MHGYFNYTSRDNEKRYMLIKIDRLERAVEQHKKKREDAERTLRELEKENQKQQELIE